jgi:hypothetical protein
MSKYGGSASGGGGGAYDTRVIHVHLRLNNAFGYRDYNRQCIEWSEGTYQQLICRMITKIKRENAHHQKHIKPLETIKYYTTEDGIIIQLNNIVPESSQRIEVIGWDHIPDGYTAETIKYSMQRPQESSNNDCLIKLLADQMMQMNRTLSLISQRLAMQNGRSISKLKEFVEANLCIICMDRPKTMTTKPCNHCEFCEECVKELIATNKTSCPMCRQENIKYEKI